MGASSLFIAVFYLPGQSPFVTMAGDGDPLQRNRSHKHPHITNEKPNDQRTENKETSSRNKQLAPQGHYPGRWFGDEAASADPRDQQTGVVQTVCDLVDQMAPRADKTGRRDLITYVADRPGHDHRYAIDAGKIKRELGWAPQETFESGIRKTVAWYIENGDWCRKVQSRYERERLGLKK